MTALVFEDTQIFLYRNGWKGKRWETIDCKNAGLIFFLFKLIFCCCGTVLGINDKSYFLKIVKLFQILILVKRGRRMRVIWVLGERLWVIGRGYVSQIFRLQSVSITAVCIQLHSMSLCLEVMFLCSTLTTMYFHITVLTYCPVFLDYFSTDKSVTTATIGLKSSIKIKMSLA